MHIVHGPQSEKFLKINSNAWLLLQGSPGFYFRKLVELRKLQAWYILHFYRVSSGLPYSCQVGAQCPISHLISRNDNFTRSHVSLCFFKKRKEFFSRCMHSRSVDLPSHISLTNLSPPSIPKPIDATQNGTTLIASDLSGARMHGRACEQVNHRERTDVRKVLKRQPLMPKQYFTYFP